MTPPEGRAYLAQALIDRKRPRLLGAWVAASVSALAAFPPATGAAEAPTLFVGRFVTLDPARPSVDALGVRDGRIVAAGTRTEVERALGPAARRVEVPGVAVPGLADAHAHALGTGEQLERLDLRGLSKGEIVARVAEAAARTSRGAWIRGQGWDQGHWDPPEFPTAAELDRATGDHPVLLERIDSHSAWLNTRALAAAGLTAGTPDPAGGRILRGPGGAPSGIVVDAALALVERALPLVTHAERRARLEAALATYARWGLTSVHDAGVDPETLAIYRELASADRLPVRVYAMARDGDPLPARPEVGLGGGRLTIRAVKLMLDGALGSRGAQLSRPYADAPDDTGLELLDDAGLRARIADATRRGLQVAIHAIGDRAVRRALDALAEAGPATRALRPRIEHVSVLEPALRPRFAELGVVASLQPNFVGEYSRWAADRVGADRAAWVYATRSLLAAGARIAAGSDFPAADSGEAVATLFCLVTRRGAGGEPVEGWFPEQAVDADTALRLMTVEPAWAAFQEADLGMLAPGRYADFTALSGDPRAAAPGALRALEVRLTVVGGRIAYAAEGAAVSASSHRR